MYAGPNWAHFRGYSFRRASTDLPGFAFFTFIEILKNINYLIIISSSMYNGTSLLRSPTVLGKSDLNGEVTLLQGVICTVEYNLGLSHGDCNGEVFLLVR